MSFDLLLVSLLLFIIWKRFEDIAFHSVKTYTRCRVSYFSEINHKKNPKIAGLCNSIVYNPKSVSIYMNHTRVQFISCNKHLKLENKCHKCEIISSLYLSLLFILNKTASYVERVQDDCSFSEIKQNQKQFLVYQRENGQTKTQLFF